MVRVSYVSSLSQQSAEKDEQDIPDLLHLEKNVELDHPENLTCLERKSHIGYQNLSQSFVCSSPHNRDSDILDADQSKHMLEGFIIDASTADGEVDIAQLGINYESTIQRDSILEQICKSASANTPLSHSTSSFGFGRTQNLYQSLPNGVLEHLDLSTFLSEEDVNKQIRASYSCLDEVKDSKLEIPCSDYQPSYGCQLGGRSGNQYQSPVGKFWERIPSRSSSSEKGLNLNPELTCFPIEEDPNSSEENETADVAGKVSDELDSTAVNSHVKRLPLASITNSSLNPPASVSAAERSHARGSLDSVNTDVSCTGHHNKAKSKLGSSFRNMSAAKVKQTSLMGAKGIKQAKESLRRSSRPKLSAKSSFKSERQKLSEKGPSHNNIVSNVSSLIPLVQQKQAAAVCTGKRDVKVKALEAAEAAKRLEEKKENERKMRKEAMKHERARLEQENSKKLELHKKKKEEEKKKKEADAMARKRLREKEEKNERERKGKRVEEARRQQREQDDKTHAKRTEKDKGLPTNDERTMAKKKCNTDMDMCQKEKERVGKTSMKQESEPKPTETLRNASFQAIPSPGRCHISDNSTDHEKGPEKVENPKTACSLTCEREFSLPCSIPASSVKPSISEGCCSSLDSCRSLTADGGKDSTTTLTSINFDELPDWEFRYIRDIIRSSDLMMEDFVLGKAQNIIALDLFDQLENQKTRTNKNADEQLKIKRRLLFDSVVECLEFRCKQSYSGSIEALAKWTTLVQRKELLAEEVYREIAVWTGMADLKVDEHTREVHREVIVKEMSTHGEWTGTHGKWTDSSFEVFEVGVDIEQGILSSLIDELIHDLM